MVEPAKDRMCNNVSEPFYRACELMPQHQDIGFKPPSRLETIALEADE